MNIDQGILMDVITLVGSDLPSLEIYIRRAINGILRYLNDSAETDQTVQDKYADAIIDYSIILFKRKGTEGIKQYTEGGQSLTVETVNSIPQSVKVLLPKPRIRVGGY